MKKSFCLLLCFLMMSSSFAQTVAGDENYKILGKGIEDRETGDVIVLSCLEEQCANLQHLRIHENKVEHFGPIFPVSHETKNAFKKALKKMNQDYKTYKRNTHSNKELRKSLPYAGVLIGGVLGVLFPISLYGIFGLMIVGVFFGEGDAPISKNPTQISKATVDQNGWNWAENPHSISHRKFNLYFQYIDSKK